MQMTRAAGPHPKLGHPDAFITRHVGPDEGQIAAMLKSLGYDVSKDAQRAEMPLWYLVTLVFLCVFVLQLLVSGSLTLPVRGQRRRRRLRPGAAR